MTVHIHAGYWARPLLGADAVEISFEGHISAIEAVVMAGIPEDEAGPMELCGKIIPPEHTLANGDTVRVYAKIVGG